MTALLASRRSAQRSPVTPLVPVQLAPRDPVVWCKLEYLNPSGSIKDRIAEYILDKARRRGRLRPGGTVIEASSGSTSIALARACAQRDLHFVAVMPEGVSDERVLMIRAYGAEVCLTPKTQGLRGAIAETERRAAGTGAFLPCQFANPDNAEAHRRGTARELLAQIPGGRADAVVSGVGTGGTLVGLYQGLRKAGGTVIPVLARPVNIRSTPEVECCSFSSRIPGVVDSLSVIFSRARLQGLETIEVNDEEALETTRRLIRKGFPVGPSSGLNYAAAVALAKRGGPAAKVVTVFADRMERYFSTELFRPFRRS